MRSRVSWYRFISFLVPAETYRLCVWVRGWLDGWVNDLWFAVHDGDERMMGGGEVMEMFQALGCGLCEACAWRGRI